MATEEVNSLFDDDVERVLNLYSHIYIPNLRRGRARV